jgi:osmotically-inducible protein OsmY
VYRCSSQTHPGKKPFFANTPRRAEYDQLYRQNQKLNNKLSRHRTIQRKFCLGRINTSLLGALTFGVVTLLLVSLGLSWYHSHEIEQKIVITASELLATAGFPQPELEINGRTVILLGNVDANIDRKQMVELIRQLTQVDHVEDKRIVTNYAIGRKFELHSYAGITTVEGELPEQSDIDLIINAIRSSYGADPLGADLRIHQAVQRPSWIDNFDNMLELLTTVSPLQIISGADTLRITGTLSDKNQQTRLASQLNKLLGSNTKLLFDIKLPSNDQEPSIQLEYKNGLVRVDGTVPSQQFVDQLIQSANLAFGVDNTINNLKVDSKIRESEILDATLRAIFPLAITNWFNLDIKDDEVRIRGMVKTVQELDIVRQQMRDNFGYGTRLINLIKKQPNTG